MTKTIAKTRFSKVAETPLPVCLPSLPPALEEVRINSSLKRALHRSILLLSPYPHSPTGAWSKPRSVKHTGDSRDRLAGRPGARISSLETVRL